MNFGPECGNCPVPCRLITSGGSARLVAARTAATYPATTQDRGPTQDQGPGAAGGDARRITGWLTMGTGGSAACCAARDAVTPARSQRITLRLPPEQARQPDRRTRFALKIQSATTDLLAHNHPR